MTQRAETRNTYDRNACLTDDTVQALLDESLMPAEIAAVEEHLSSCAACRDRCEAEHGSPAWWSDAKASLQASEAGEETTPPKDHAAESWWKLLGPSDDPRMLGRIGMYEVVGLLGRGGMGVVFKAYDSALNRYVAIKMLLPHLASSGAARKRFAREAQAAAAVVDDHVLPIYGVDQWLGTPYFVMKYSRGDTLQKRIQEQGPLEVDEILRIGMQAARGLAAAHNQGLVHRDVKPSNILLDGGVERVLIADFGLARAADDASLTHTGAIAGTPQFMSPEQVRGETVDARSDLFSLGCVLYTLCAGRPPFRAESSYAVLRMITDQEPRALREINSAIPDWLAGIIGKLMAKNPTERFASAREVADLFEHCLAQLRQPRSSKLSPELQALARPLTAARRSGVRSYGFIAAAFMGLLAAAAFMMQATNPPDITGQWHTPQWSVKLEHEALGAYRGEITDSATSAQGSVKLEWSRLQRRFNGEWRMKDGPFGQLSLRQVDGELHGAIVLDPKAESAPEVPRLTDTAWSRTKLDWGTMGIVEPTTKESLAERVRRPRTLAEVEAGLVQLEDPQALKTTKDLFADDFLSPAAKVLKRMQGEWIVSKKSKGYSGGEVERLEKSKIVISVSGNNLTLYGESEQQPGKLEETSFVLEWKHPNRPEDVDLLFNNNGKSFRMLGRIDCTVGTLRMNVQIDTGLSPVRPKSFELADLVWYFECERKWSAEMLQAREAAQGYSFAPVTELNAGNRAAIDLESGKVKTLPRAEERPEFALDWLLTQDVSFFTRWANENKIDLMAEVSPLYVQSSAFVTNFKQVNILEPEDWEDADPARIFASLAEDWETNEPNRFAHLFRAEEKGMGPYLILSHLAKYPRRVTFAFETREGTRGMLQLVHRKIGSDTMVVRYRLLKKEE